MANLLGSSFDLKRIVTGFKTLDAAFENAKGKIGVPSTITELYGPTGCGKTTLSWFLAQKAAQIEELPFAMLNIEQFDPEYLQEAMMFYGYDGNIYLAEGESDEKRMDSILGVLRNKPCSAYILDSVGAISPIAEQEGKSGEANMGRRAKLMAAHVRKVNGVLLTRGELLSIFINHVHPNLGSLGTTTTGGNTLRYMAACRIKVRQEKEYPDGSFVIEGTVIKNRFGFEGRKFYLFVLAGHGVHLGLTAFYEATKLGILTKKKGDHSFKWDNGDKVPTLATLVKKWDDPETTEIFSTFIDAVRGSTGVIASAEVEEDE